jgi:hypothetical protein
MLLEGKYATNLIPVLVDALGQLYTIISGSYGGVPTPILLDVAGRILAHLVGNDGGTIRDVTVDSSGKMIIRVQGSDGGTLRDVAVDAAGIMLSRMKGSDGGTLRDVAVDSSGFLTALMKGLDGATLRTIAVDADGVMKANLSAQDLNFLTVRPAYGTAKRVSATGEVIGGSAWSNILNVNGRGVILGGFLGVAGDTALSVSKVRAIIDGVTSESGSYVGMVYDNLLRPGQGMFYVIRYNDLTTNYYAGITPNLTFESSISLGVYNNVGVNEYTSYDVIYALTP